MGRQSGWRHEPGSYAACPNEAVMTHKLFVSSQAFCVFTSALCETALVLFDVVLSVFNYSEMASKQQQAFRMCVHPCPRYLCCLFRRGACTVSARGSWLWALRCASLADTPIPPGVLSQWGRSGSSSPRLWSCCCRGSAEAAVLGFVNVSVRRVRDGHNLISTFTWQVQCLVSGLGSTHCGFLRPIEALTLQLSDSEELDVVSANGRDTEDSPPQSRAYEELVEVITRAVDWPAEREDVCSKKKTSCLLVPNLNAGDWCFFPDLHTEVWRLWEEPGS